MVLALLLAATTASCGESVVACGVCGPCEAKVLEVVDGDTIELDDGTRVRLLCVDTPETKSGVECWGPEASAYSSSQLLGQTVTLQYDAACQDNFGRTLAWVWLGEDLFQKELLELGHASSLMCTPGLLYGTAMLEAEARAKSTGAGLWGACPEGNP